MIVSPSRSPAGAALGIDVGGGRIKSWLIQAGQGRVADESISTPRGDSTGERAADAVAVLVRRAAQRFGPLSAVGVATPGILDETSGICRLAVNLGWRDVPVRELVAARVDVPVVVVQDVRAGAAAEKASGAGAGRPGGLLFAALGTGLAIANVDGDGRPIGSGWAGEVGQLRIPDGPNRGMRVEQVASAGGLASRFGVAGADEVALARAAGDPRAARLWNEAVELLADVLAWSVAVLAPATVAVGGGLSLAGDALLLPLRRLLDARLEGFPAVEVVLARHGAAAAAVGAAELARRHADRTAGGATS